MAAACRPIDFRVRCVWFSSCRTQSKQSVQPGIRPLFYVWRVYARLSLRLGIQASVYWRGALRILCSAASTPVIRRFGRFGDLSYGVYIYAFPVQQTMVWLTGNKISFINGLSM